MHDLSRMARAGKALARTRMSSGLTRLHSGESNLPDRLVR